MCYWVFVSAPHFTSHSLSRLAVLLVFLASTSLGGILFCRAAFRALCCGFLPLTEALSTLSDGYFKCGFFVTKTGSCSCKRIKCFLSFQLFFNSSSPNLNHIPSLSTVMNAFLILMENTMYNAFRK